mgnify:CR=1 FL=1
MISVVVSISLDSYVDIDIPILDNFGAFDVFIFLFRSLSMKFPTKQAFFQWARKCCALFICLFKPFMIICTLMKFQGRESRTNLRLR